MMPLACSRVLVVALSLFMMRSHVFSFHLCTTTRNVGLSRMYPEGLFSSRQHQDDPPSRADVYEDAASIDPTARDSTPGRVDRRRAMGVLLAATGLMALGPGAACASSGDELESVSLGTAQWARLGRRYTFQSKNHPVPPEFAAYATRFLINYDPSVSSWWMSLQRRYQLQPNEVRQRNLGRSFGALAKSLELSIGTFLQQYETPQEAYERLWDRFEAQYYNQDDEPIRQLALLFALLPAKEQPISRLRKLSFTSNKQADAHQLPSKLHDDLAMLLPSIYTCVPVAGASYFAIYPCLDISIKQSLSSVLTPFGPLADVPLIRDSVKYSPSIYANLALSGAVGCALTHAVVIPLDVVKTRTQIDSEQFQGFWGSGLRILQEEGISGLFLGAQATLAGYMWYGASVYPSYTFFKRFLSLSVLPEEIVAANTDAIALIAGALASIVAGLGLTPLEAARIRVVADPAKYRTIGLKGTLQAIASENPQAGWSELYAGLPSLLTRQVIFGSVKFLAFERACALIFSTWPSLREETWTSLAVSLIAGAFSGALSAVVSQPADAVLTYVAQDSESSSRGLLSTCLTMVEREGVSCLFRGVGSRCIWATSIIAGQFYIYEAFRTFSGVSPDDLSQVYELILSPK